MSHTALALTLGHNSSAILIKGGHIIAGYEEERFSQKKSDSSFPIMAITELRKRHDIPEDVDICVSHWFLDGEINRPENAKYWSPNSLLAMFPKAKVHSLELGKFSHHDAHALSAQVFAGNDFANEYHILVMDGFGTAGECISIYKCRANHALYGSVPYTMDLVSRVYGFNYSAGMFYQYATAFCGMKMHNHEYKMLAYETHINKIPVNIADVNNYIDEFSMYILKKINKGMIDGYMDPMVSLDALVQTAAFVEHVLSEYLKAFEMENADVFTRRVMVSYFSQRHVENVVRAVVNAVKPENVLVVGGLFYNVKINHIICDMIPGRFCAMPLAGDQGAALGVYQKEFGNLSWPGHLFWGERTLDYDRLPIENGVRVLNEADALDDVILELATTGFVNLVRGSMEFGPRALCNTSTLAIPHQEIGALVNKMNDRTNEMPFALVMTKEQAQELFIDTEKVHKSLDYMIMARKFRDGKHEDVLGGAHFYPLSSEFTCRPQVTDDPFMVALLEKFGPLINTSWNYHGVPIVNGTDQVIYTHSMERAKLPELDFKTIIVKE